jgi:hypothetical protein
MHRHLRNMDFQHEYRNQIRHYSGQNRRGRNYYKKLEETLKNTVFFALKYKEIVKIKLLKKISKDLLNTSEFFACLVLFGFLNCLYLLLNTSKSNIS